MSSVDKSDIGNLYSDLRAYAAISDRHYSYLKDHWTGLTEWKMQADAKLLELLNYSPRKIPLNPVVTDRIEREDCLQEEIEYFSSENIRIRGTVLVPKSGKGPYPAVIALHDHGGFYYWGREKILRQDMEPAVLSDFKKQCYGGRSWANELAGRGFIVMCMDAFYFGSRKLDVSCISDEIFNMCPVNPRKHEYGTRKYIEEYNHFCEWFESLLVKHILCSGATWPGIILYDDMRSVDYLAARKDVDQDRIGCCGLSVGGYRAVHLAALDPRIKCSVAAGWMTTMEELLFDHLRYHTYMTYIPGLARFMDFPDIAGMAAPNRLFIQQCSQDFLYTSEGMQMACSAIERIYAKAGCKENFIYSFYDNDHEFSIKMQEDAFSWLEKNLLRR